jgi:hypothetical protein
MEEERKTDWGIKKGECEKKEGRESNKRRDKVRRQIWSRENGM